MSQSNYNTPNSKFTNATTANVQIDLKYNFKEEAIPLIKIVNEDGKDVYEVNKEAVDFLSTVEAPVSVVTVAGMYRTGKSYLLNKIILDKRKGFEVGPTVNPCTKGLWVYCSPIEVYDAQDRKVNVIVVDSEGLGALDQDSNYDNKTFSLSLLLASVFIYNSTGAIDENSLESLNLILNLSKHIQLRNSEKGTDEEFLEQNFPAFYWVLRDFSLKLEDEQGNPITPAQYLELALKENEGYSDSVAQKNSIRSLIKSYFKDRHCFPFVSPLSDESQLQNLDEIPLSNLRREFQDQVLAFRRKVYSDLKIKTMNGKPLSGYGLGALLQTWVSSINAGVVPILEDSFEQVALFENERLVRKAADLYDETITDALTNKMPCDLVYIKDLHKEIKMRAVDYFKSNALGSNSEKYVSRVLDKCRGIRVELEESNLNSFKESCDEVMGEIMEEIEASIDANKIKNVEELAKEFGVIEKNFCDNFPNIPQKREIWLGYVTRWQTFAASMLHEKAVRATNDSVKNLEAQLSESLQKHIQLSREKAETEKNSTSRVYELEDSLNSLKKKFLEVEQAKSEQENLVETFKLERAEAEENMKKKLSQVKTKIEEEVRASLSAKSTQDDELFKAQSEHEKKIAILQEKFTQQGDQLTLMKEKLKRKDEELSATKESYSSKLNNIKSKFDEDLTKLKKELDLKSHKMTTMDKEYRKLDNIKNFEKTSYDSKINDLNEQVEELTKKLSESKHKKPVKMQSTEDKLELVNKIKNLEQKLNEVSESEQNIKTISRELEKQVEIEGNNTRIIQDQYTSLKQMYDDLKKSYHLLMGSIEHQPSTDTSEEEIIVYKQRVEQELKDARQNLQKFQTESHNEIHELKVQVEQLTRTKRCLLEEKEERIQSLEESTSLLEAKVQSLSAEKNEIEEKVKHTQALYESKDQQVTYFENILSTKDADHNSKVKQLEATYTQKLEEFKSMFTSSKDENDKAQMDKIHKLQTRCTYAEEKLAQEVKSWEVKYEQDMDEVKQEIARYSAENSERIESLESDKSELEAQIEDNQIKFDKERSTFTASVQEYTNEIKKLQDNLSNEKVKYTRKIDELNSEIEMLNKKIQMLEGECNNNKKLVEKKDALLESQRESLEQEAEELRETLRETKLTLKNKSSELQVAKAKFDRELSVLNEKAKYSEQKLAETTSSYDDLQKRYEDYLMNSRDSEHQSILSEKYDNLHRDYSTLKQECEQARLETNEAEAILQRHTLTSDSTIKKLKDKLEQFKNEAEENKSSLMQKFDTMNLKFDETVKKYESEKSVLVQTTESLKAYIKTRDAEYAELASSADRQRIILNSKIQHLEDFKQKMSADLMDSNDKFEQAMVHLNQRHAAERDKWEKSHASLMQSAERRQSEHVENLRSENERLHREMQEREESYERQYQEIQQQVMRLKASEGMRYENKYQDQSKENQRLSAELRELKEKHRAELEKSLGSIEGQRKEQSERINSIKRSFEDEKASLNERVFRLEKEKMQWNIERQIMSDNKGELEEKYNQLFSKINLQQRELESLKKPPYKLKERDSAKNSIREMMNKSGSGVLQRNILGSNSSNTTEQVRQHSNASSGSQPKSNINIPLSLRKCASNGFLNSDPPTDRDESVSNFGDNDEMVKSSASKRLNTLGKSPQNKFKLNLFSEDKQCKENFE